MIVLIIHGVVLGALIGVLEHRVRTGRLYQPGTIAARVCRRVQGGDQ